MDDLHLANGKYSLKTKKISANSNYSLANDEHDDVISNRGDFFAV